MKFHRNSKLQHHIQVTHTLEKTFKCNYQNCSAAYFGRPYLDRHIEEKHLKIKYDCQVKGCDSTFIRLDGYKKHLVAHKDITDAERDNLRMKLKLYRSEILKN